MHIQILRRDFLSKQKQWETDLARAAPESPLVLDDEEQLADHSLVEGEVSQMMHVCTSLLFASTEDEVVNQILFREAQEIKELIALRQLAEMAARDDQKPCSGSDCGNDEDEYDKLFVEIMSKDNGSRGITACTVPDHRMDTSLG